jgi:hypothetical protein
VPVICVLASACASASVLDARLTADGRAAVAVRGQGPAQHVDDMTECRERLMDGLFYAGAYVIYFPLPHVTPTEALGGWRESFAECMRQRGYELPRLQATPPARAARP